MGQTKKNLSTISNDITTRLAELISSESTLLIDTIINNLPLGISLWDTTHHYVKVNTFLATMHGRTPEDHIGRHAREIHPDRYSEFAKIINKITQTKEPELGLEFFYPQVKSGLEPRRWLKNFYPILRSGQVIAVLEIDNEITENWATVESLKRQALLDPLTSLPNRTYLKEKLSQMLASSQTTNEAIAVLFLDLDRFKFINDTLGHGVGDKLLRSVGERLKNNIRQNDIVGRLGGDEFVILLKDIQTSIGAVNVAQKILRSLRMAFKIDGHRFHITTSIGISMYPHDGNDAEMLIRSADTAMYKAKEKAGNDFELYKPTMSTKAYAQLTLENNLREALVKQELVIYYQPVIDLANDEMVGVEALVHWLHPKLGLIFPTEFIPLAEETGLIIPIGKWLIQNACLQNQSWQNQGLKPLKMAINLSDRQLKDPNLMRVLKAALTDSKLDPSNLELELTENIITQHADTAIKNLNKLKALGINVSIDNFGTSYSSLSQLKKFPVDILKIDQSFVKNSITDTDDAAIITAIISMAHRLHLKVIAEGVETVKQLEFLRSLGCDGIQGYLFSLPVTAETITLYLIQNRKLMA